MPTYLYLHSESGDGMPGKKFRGKYTIHTTSCEFSRDVDYKGEINSDVKGGIVNLTLDGFGDELLFNWLFRPDMQKDGEIVTVDMSERVVEKICFERGEALKYRILFDADNKNAVTAELTIKAGGITTDNDLYYEAR